MSGTSDALSPALEALVARYGATLKQVGERHGLTGHLVDEVIQEVRISLWRARPGVAQLAAVSAGYMYRTAVTAALQVLRRRRAKRESSSELSPVVQATAASPSATPEQVLELAELGAQVRAAVAELDAPRQAVVRLHLHGYHREEIAELLGWTEAKTRNLLYRGLEDLRRALAARGITPEHAA